MSLLGFSEDDKLQQYNQILKKLPAEVLTNWNDVFTVDFTHNTTAIEGNTLSLIDTKIILEDGIVPKETSLAELDQIRGHADAWAFVKECVRNKISITENIIKDIHERVLPVRGVGGIYREHPVYLQGSYYVPPNYKKIRPLMKDFAFDIQTKHFESPIEEAAWIHAEFVKIHPFPDGNGRTARLLMNYSLLLNNFPPVNIKKDNVKEYFTALNEYSMNDNLQPFVKLLKANVEKSLNDFIEAYSDYIDDLEDEDDNENQR